MSTEDKKPLPQQQPLEKPPVNIEIPNLNENIKPGAFDDKRWSTTDTSTVIQKGNDRTDSKGTDNEG